MFALFFKSLFWHLFLKEKKKQKWRRKQMALY